jgi:hypothetical protein
MEENSNSISFDQSHTIKENKKKVFNWYNNKKKLVYIKYKKNKNLLKWMVLK